MLAVLLCLWKIACIDKLHYCKPPTCPPNVGENEVEGEEWSVIPSRLTVIPVWLVI